MQDSGKYVLLEKAFWFTRKGNCQIKVDEAKMLVELRIAQRHAATDPISNNIPEVCLLFIDI